MNSIALRRVVAYVVVGGITVATYYALIGLLWGMLGLHYLLGVTIAYLCAIVFHFSANRKVTFEASQNSAKLQIPRYVAMAAINYVITVAVVDVSVRLLGLHVYVGSTVAILATMVTGYLGMRHWVFSTKPRS